MTRPPPANQPPQRSGRAGGPNAVPTFLDVEKAEQRAGDRTRERYQKSQTSRNFDAAMPEPMAPASAPIASMINITVWS